jgi:hypothetical protein
VGHLAEVSAEAGVRTRDANENEPSVEADAPTADAGTDVSAESGAAGSDGSSDSSADACTVILPSDYDQSCVLDSDCVAVGEVAACPPPACSGQCAAGIVSASVAAEYKAAIARATGDVPPLVFPDFCNCEAVLIPVCRNGKCEDVADSLPEGPSACTDAGARCLLSTIITCATPGPDGGCGYSDEICCFN